ncbi:MAG: hypothetical protein HYZ47_02515 [Simkania negevensis]|nr:hypothetical protein [Simkania negevensis]
MSKMKQVVLTFLLCMFGAYSFSHAEEMIDLAHKLILNVEGKSAERTLHILSLWGGRNRLPKDVRKELHLFFKTNSIEIQSSSSLLQSYIIGCKTSFSEEEFEQIKRELIGFIENPLSFEASEKLDKIQIERITLAELNDHNSDLYRTLYFKMQIVESGKKPIEFLDSSKGSSSLPKLKLASSDAKSRVAPFHQLRLTPQDQNNIEKLIKSLGDKGYSELLYKKKEMDKLGDKIHPVHPLRFIGYIMSRGELKERMPKIAHDRLKWIGFIKGFGDRMSHEKHRSQLLSYVPGLAQMLGVEEKKIEHYIHSSDWGGLVKFLTNAQKN